MADEEKKEEKKIDESELNPQPNQEEAVKEISDDGEPDREEKKGFFGRKCEKCEKFKKEREEYESGWRRALADYKNLQNETNKMRAEWARMSEQQILEEFIPIYENFKLAFRTQTNSFNQEQLKWVDGIKYIMKQFVDVLKSHGIEEIVTVGEIFDPRCHEAISSEIVEGKPEGEIIKEVEGGYKMGDKVIKAAKVIVAK
ncbi:MAG: nucleotide exchange factor GrpE [Patescibacteria group bacterium]|nr:nucleotide exchange factor GrpE [Patescibacteria group bacterium]